MHGEEQKFCVLTVAGEDVPIDKVDMLRARDGDGDLIVARLIGDGGRTLPGREMGGGAPPFECKLGAVIDLNEGRRLSIGGAAPLVAPRLFARSDAPR